MTDLEMTNLCAEALGIEDRHDSLHEFKFIGNKWYEHNWNPLHNDEQAMALVKKFHPTMQYNALTKVWSVWIPGVSPEPSAWNEDLNCAIVECVARLQKEKP